MKKFIGCHHPDSNREATVNFEPACPFCVEGLINEDADKANRGQPELIELQSRWAAMVGNVCPYGCGNSTKLVAVTKCNPVIENQVIAHAYCYSCQVMIRADWNYKGKEPVKTLKTIKAAVAKKQAAQSTLVNAKSVRRAAMYAIPYRWRWIAALFN